MYSEAKLLAERTDAALITSRMIIRCKKMKYPGFREILYVPQNNVFLNPKEIIYFLAIQKVDPFPPSCEISQGYLHLFGRVPHKRF